MKFNEDLAAIHAYLCADGYVIKNPPTQVHKYYYIGLRNTNIVLLKDFQSRFYRFFGVKPIITNDGRAKIQNKAIYQKLTENYVYYSDRWNMPSLNKNLLKIWLRAYFDCDGWVSFTPAKNRAVGLESINYDGLYLIKLLLFKKFGIVSTIKKRKDRSINSLIICGRDDLIKFQKNIGFLHPKKEATLSKALNSYATYNWLIPNLKDDLIVFIKQKARISYARKQVRFNSLLKRNLISLRKEFLNLGLRSTISGPWKNPYGSIWYCLTTKLDDFNRII